MQEILEKLGLAVESGKINQASAYPPALRGMDGADELTRAALDLGIAAGEILHQVLEPAMRRVGQRFADKQAFIPDLLMAAKAMNVAIVQLRPYFLSGEVKRKGCFVIGTVYGDLHDIGKKLVALIIEGAGFEVVDLGIDVPVERFVEAVEQYPGCALGLSALLTTTMVHMEPIVQAVRARAPGTRILIGGAPLSQAFCDRIGADHYASDPQSAVDYLTSQAA